ncbi:MAG: hypothetical protein ACYCY6_02095 [Minisyncoccota bacterium]
MEMSELDRQILGVLWELQKEHEIAKRQGFPARRVDVYSRYSRREDAVIPETRWRMFAHRLGMDYTKFQAILKIITIDVIAGLRASHYQLHVMKEDSMRESLMNWYGRKLLN